jgi:catechol 2,3-dioxygenase-like lactoylglutathione lyase family enzyme
VIPVTIDHVDIRVSDIDASRAFYEGALAPLGLRVVADARDPAGAAQIGFGDSDGFSFTIHSPASAPGQDTVTTGAHIAFRAASRRAVEQFHAAAIALGARSVGDPGRRPAYSAGYYGAFVLDPDGNNIEAVVDEPV